MARTIMAKNELVSLALLKISPMHAYAINSIIEQMGIEHWAQVSRASIYAALKRLEKRGAIDVKLEKVDNMPERKVFSITNEGEDLLNSELKEALTTTCENNCSIFHIAINLFFGASPEEGMEWAKIRIEKLKENENHVNSELVCMRELGCESAVITLIAALKYIQVEVDLTNKFIAILTDSPGYYPKYLEIMRSKIQNGETLSPKDSK